MQSTPIPPNIAGGLYPTAAAQSSPGPKQGQQGQTQPQSIAPSSQDVSDTNQGRASKQQESSSSKQSQSSEQELSQSERARLSKLQQRDREVRAHEQAHVAAGGPYVQGGANLETRLGPDGQFYAVGGEVSMDASEVPGDPEATVEKARTLRRAALAPARPSGQDLQVAAQAAQMILEARQEMRQEESDPGQALGIQAQKDSDSAQNEEQSPEAAPGLRPRAIAAYQNQSGSGQPAQAAQISSNS